VNPKVAVSQRTPGTISFDPNAITSYAFGQSACWIAFHCYSVNFDFLIGKTSLGLILPES
jgi:hypothetical protein